MATPVVPSQTFSFEKTGHTTFKSINWGGADEQLSSGWITVKTTSCALRSSC
jgi:hypothetical protein